MPHTFDLCLYIAQPLDGAAAGFAEPVEMQTILRSRAAALSDPATQDGTVVGSSNLKLRVCRLAPARSTPGPEADRVLHCLVQCVQHAASL
jgi:hypothetical protein